MTNIQRNTLAAEKKWLAAMQRTGIASGCGWQYGGLIPGRFSAMTEAVGRAQQAAGEPSENHCGPELISALPPYADGGDDSGKSPRTGKTRGEANGADTPYDAGQQNHTRKTGGGYAAVYHITAGIHEFMEKASVKMQEFVGANMIGGDFHPSLRGGDAPGGKTDAVESEESIADYSMRSSSDGTENFHSVRERISSRTETLYSSACNAAEKIFPDAGTPGRAQYPGEGIRLEDEHYPADALNEPPGEWGSGGLIMPGITAINKLHNHLARITMNQSAPVYSVLSSMESGPGIEEHKTDRPGVSVLRYSEITDHRQEKPTQTVITMDPPPQAASAPGEVNIHFDTLIGNITYEGGFEQERGAFEEDIENAILRVLKMAYSAQ